MTSEIKPVLKQMLEIQAFSGRAGGNSLPAADVLSLYCLFVFLGGMMFAGLVYYLFMRRPRELQSHAL
jgi:hypothetical protein